MIAQSSKTSLINSIISKKMILIKLPGIIIFLKDGLINNSSLNLVTSNFNHMFKKEITIRYTKCIQYHNKKYALF